MPCRAPRLAFAAPALVATALAASSASADPPARRPGAPGRLTAPTAPNPDPWLGPDKAAHFFVSATLAGGGYALGALATDRVPERLAIGAAIALGAGLTKEALDAAGLGTPSWRDLAWNVLGTTFGLGLSVTLDYAARPGHF